MTKKIGGDELGLLGDLLPRVTQDDVPGATQRKIARVVLVETVAMRGKSVELDNNALLVPYAIDDEPRHLDVDVRQRDRVLLAEQDEQNLELTLRSRKPGLVLFQRLAQRRAAGLSVTQDTLDLAQANQPLVPPPGPCGVAQTKPDSRCQAEPVPVG